MLRIKTTLGFCLDFLKICFILYNLLNSKDLNRDFILWIVEDNYTLDQTEISHDNDFSHNNIWPPKGNEIENPLDPISQPENLHSPNVNDFVPTFSDLENQIEIVEKGSDAWQEASEVGCEELMAEENVVDRPCEVVSPNVLRPEQNIEHPEPSHQHAWNHTTSGLEIKILIIRFRIVIYIW
ncbi:unnamed protein product [Arctia plantaginis]|uniref:Uncharacterized protein n=1 Tax=Arctia plantaginis TaxID=874455 RepID=A0A8S1A1K6_ARCPL|nr:unnamed protein product [Arctia plantaginis]